MTRKCARVIFLVCFFLIGWGRTGEPRNGNSDGAVMPDVLVSLGWEHRPSYALVVEKSSQQLFLFSYDGEFKRIARFRCSTGKVPGRKKVSGDSKTPEGIYFFTDVHEDQDLTPIYGVRAFPIDYPNLIDRREGRGGYAIWLHGTDQPLKERNSNGCIVMENGDIETVSHFITLHRTPLIIVPRMTYVFGSPHNREDINRCLSEWNATLQNGAFARYRQCYAPNYAPDISWWDEWQRLRSERSHHARTPFRFRLKKISIFQHDGIFVVLADHYIRLPDKELFMGPKKFYLARNGGRIQIIGEAYPQMRKTKNRNRWMHPVISYSRRLLRWERGRVKDIRGG